MFTFTWHATAFPLSWVSNFHKHTRSVGLRPHICTRWYSGQDWEGAVGVALAAGFPRYNRQLLKMMVLVIVILMVVFWWDHLKGARGPRHSGEENEATSASDVEFYLPTVLYVRSTGRVWGQKFPWGVPLPQLEWVQIVFSYTVDMDPGAATTNSCIKNP